MERNRLNISKPIVVQVSSGATASTNVELFDALTNQNNTPDFGLPKGIGFSATVPFYTYRQLLHSLISNSYQIGLIIITILTGATNVMLLNPLAILAYNMQGDSATKTEMIVRNTFQNVTSQVIHKVNFLLESSTKITIGGTFRKNTTVEYAFYPTKSYEANDIENYGREYQLPDFETVRKIGNKQTNKFLINL